MNNYFLGGLNINTLANAAYLLSGFFSRITNMSVTLAPIPRDPKVRRITAAVWSSELQSKVGLETDSFSLRGNIGFLSITTAIALYLL